MLWSVGPDMGFTCPDFSYTFTGSVPLGRPVGPLPEIGKFLPEATITPLGYTAPSKDSGGDDVEEIIYDCED